MKKEVAEMRATDRGYDIDAYYGKWKFVCGCDAHVFEMTKKWNHRMVLVWDNEQKSFDTITAQDLAKQRNTLTCGLH